MPSWARLKRSSSARALLWIAAIGAGVGLALASGSGDPPRLELARGPDHELVPRKAPLEAPATLRAEPRRTDPLVKSSPGRLTGVVRWDFGSPVADAAIELLDEAGETVAEATTDDEGRYELVDEALAGAEVRVTVATGEQHQRDVATLRAGERRDFDVVVGAVREVVGWVLDGAGDPQPGVAVELAWESAGSRWRAVTDAGGQFTFVDAPVTSLRVTADGGDLGVASARLAQTDATRREVTLVLEPTGAIIVSARPEIAALGEVTVRCFSAAAHGEDGLWNDDLRPVEVAPIYDETTYDGGVSEAPPGEALTMPEIEALIGNALRDWDQGDPRGSLVRMALGFATANPQMEAEMRRDVGAQFPELAGASLEALAGAAADKVMAEEPRLLDMMGLAALRVAEGSPPMEAFMLAESEARAAPAEPAPTPEEIAAAGYTENPPYPGEDDAVEAAVEAPAYDELPVEPEVDPEMGGAEGMPETGAEYVDGDLDPGAMDDPMYRRIEELRALTGISAVTTRDEPRSVVATGRTFQPIPVRGAFEYQVSIVTADGYELVCGSVFVSAGEEVDINCGGEGVATLEGRVVDTAGKGVAGAEVGVYTDDVTSTTTDAAGRYRLEVKASTAMPVMVLAHDGAQTWNASRRQQNIRPGHLTEVPDIVARRPEEMPVHTLDTPYGGVGASIQLGAEGIVVAALFDDGPLAMAGVEAGDVIVRIGEEIGASLSEDDALTLLRGEAGTEVDLTLRSAAGELYDLMVTRGLVNPVPTTDIE